MEDAKRIVILGPTASGKTRLAIRMAGEHGAEIISADSRQCYIGMEIGTAAPTPEEQDLAPHHNVSIFTPDQPDTAVAFRGRAMEWEREIRDRGSIPLYSGGSTLYLQSILMPPDPTPPASPRNLEKLRVEAETQGLQVLYDRLRDVDPQTAERMDGLNRHRIFRALDVWMQTGTPFSAFHTRRNEEITPEMEGTRVIGIRVGRAELHSRIEQRVDRMLKEGFLDEVKALMEAGHAWDLPPLRTVGYPQLRDVLLGEIGLPEARSRIIAATRQYARRQETWFARWPFIEWVDAAEAAGL